MGHTEARPAHPRFRAVGGISCDWREQMKRTLKQLADMTVEFFESSKEGRAILVAQERGEIAERQAHVDSIEEAKRELTGILPTLLASEVAAKAERDRAHAAFLAADAMA